MGGAQAGQAGRLGTRTGSRFEPGRAGQAPRQREGAKTINPTQILQRTRSSTRRPIPRREHRVSNDHSADLALQAEPSPREMAEEGTGRPPAPLGARDAEDQA